MGDCNKALFYINELTLFGYTVCFSKSEKYMMILIRNSEKNVYDFVLVNPYDDDIEAELKKAVEILVNDGSDE